MKARAFSLVAAAVAAALCLSSATGGVLAKDVDFNIEASPYLVPNGTPTGLEVIKNVSGQGTVLLLQDALEVSGQMDFAQGTIEVFGMPGLSLAGNGSVGRVELGTGTMTIADSAGRQFGAVEIDRLGMDGGTVVLKGFQSDDPHEVGYGSWLSVGSIQAYAPPLIGGMSSEASGVVRVQGDNGVLILGARRGTVAATRAQLADAAAFSARAGERPSLIVPSSGVDSIGSVAVTVGNGTQKNGVITIGSDARLLIDDTSATRASGVRAEVETMPESDIVIWGWQGQELTLDWLTADEASTVTLLGTNFYGETQRENGTIRLVRRYFADVAGLNAKTMVLTAESLAPNDLTRRLPGYAFLTDAFGAHDRVGIDMMANTVDAGVFLPMASGIALGVEANHRMSERSVLEHLRRPMQTETHWWVNAWGGRLDRDRYFDGGSGTWGVSADYAGVALGLDTRLNNGWLVGVSFSGSSADGETKGRVAATASEATSAAISLSAAKGTDMGRWLMALTASQAQTESTQLTNAHRLHAEPNMTMVSLSGQWIGRYDSVVRVEPRLGLSVYWAKMQNGIVTDTDLLTANSGDGFDTQASDRLWGVVETGVDLSYRIEIGGVSIVPTFGADLRYAFGDLAWELTSRLHGTRIGDRTVWDATSDVSGRVRLALDVMQCYDKPKLQGGWFGFGAKPVEGRTETVDWRLSVNASYERGQGGVENAVVGLEYRLNF
ncbi:MAG: autotransporter outer membrane beta-barrel domain-containing protein [Duodenibacillus sp.]|nr:autotransporter outer membrane beta-barrel domain-containing protein [Duodenibacillus sp.]